MFELRKPDELFPRLDIEEGSRILAVDGPNIVQGRVEADFRSGIELPQIDNESYDAIFAWFTDNDEKRAIETINNSERILNPGGSIWLIVPKKNSVEHHKVTGVTSEKLIPYAKDSGLTEKKTLGVGPHYFGIRMQKHGEKSRGK